MRRRLGARRQLYSRLRAAAAGGGPTGELMEGQSSGTTNIRAPRSQSWSIAASSARRSCAICGFASNEACARSCAASALLDGLARAMAPIVARCVEDPKTKPRHPRHGHDKVQPQQAAAHMRRHYLGERKAHCQAAAIVSSVRVFQPYDGRSNWIQLRSGDALLRASGTRHPHFARNLLRFGDVRVG